MTDLRLSRRAAAPGVPSWALGVAGVATFLLLAELLPRIGVVDARFTPPASEVFLALVRQASDAAFWLALLHTIVTWGAGLAIALLAGIALGVLFGTVRFLREFTASTIEFLRPVPSVALLPVAVLLLGTGMASTIFLVVYAAFWQVLIQVMAGVQDVDPVAADTARSYRFGLWRRIRTVVWPTALPYAMTGLRLAASVALILTVTGELLISFDGIGGRLEVARQSGAVASMYAYVFVAALLGLAVNLLARRFESSVLFWHPSIRGEVAA
ncbi:ABC transporter permease [Protaetiibacter intestinalis]|uniref:ABC transporter permease n=1 Tax=Protaetiibacter intestinalis TaxID=2419774 RepID=A0A387B785_9MICO|nr:ABC transporter permease [Protaetiibacter intestinalis]AYF98217.1 ABC transporter permease [Protaetiibacter intestinalis]